MHDYTKFCVSKLRECLRSECPYFDWASGEEVVKGKDFTTWVDVYGKSNNRLVLIQFEMHREGISTNALKIAYCLENDRRFREKQILVLHVFSPFHEKPEKDTTEPEQISVPEWVPPDRQNKYRTFQKQQKAKEARKPGRRNAYEHKLLCLFLKRKGVLDNATTTYEVIEWSLKDFLEVREATIVLPEKEPFPEGTQQAVASLAKQLREAMEEWQKR